MTNEIKAVPKGTLDTQQQMLKELKAINLGINSIKKIHLEKEIKERRSRRIGLAISVIAVAIAMTGLGLDIIRPMEDLETFKQRLSELTEPQDKIQVALQ